MTVNPKRHLREALATAKEEGSVHLNPSDSVLIDFKSESQMVRNSNNYLLKFTKHFILC